MSSNFHGENDAATFLHEVIHQKFEAIQHEMQQQIVQFVINVGRSYFVEIQTRSKLLCDAASNLVVFNVSVSIF